MFKKGDIVRYTGPAYADFHVQVDYVREGLGIFAGEVVGITANCKWHVGFYADDWYSECFTLDEDFTSNSPVTSVLFHDNIAQLQQENEQLKQRLIEAERNALYWTAFDCPVNRDVAERILRKES